MSKFDVSIPVSSVKTVEEFDALLESYKIQSPAKYAAKLESGELDKFRATLIGDKKVVEDKPIKAKK